MALSLSPQKRGRFAHRLTAEPRSRVHGVAGLAAEADCHRRLRQALAAQPVPVRPPTGRGTGGRDRWTTCTPRTSAVWRLAALGSALCRPDDGSRTPASRPSDRREPPPRDYVPARDLAPRRGCRLATATRSPTTRRGCHARACWPSARTYPPASTESLGQLGEEDTGRQLASGCLGGEEISGRPVREPAWRTRRGSAPGLGRSGLSSVDSQHRFRRAPGCLPRNARPRPSGSGGSIAAAPLASHAPVSASPGPEGIEVRRDALLEHRVSNALLLEASLSNQQAVSR